MEKANEVASLRRDIASTSEVKREAKSLKLQVSELKEDKRLCMAPIDKLEVELRDVELQHVEADGFAVERYVSGSFRQRKFSGAAPSTQRPFCPRETGLKLEVKNAVEDMERAEAELTSWIDSLRKLWKHATDDYEAKLWQRDERIESYCHNKR